MHDLLQVMGRNIVFQESNAGGRSRLWSAGEINDVLEGNKGDGSVESIVLHIQKSFEADWHPDCFSNMKELRLLDLSKVRLSRNLNFLPSALKIMRWDYYALESLPPVGQLHELESLRLCKSKIRKLWNGAPALDKLRIIDLSDSKCLEIPDFSGTPNLEELLLNRCRKLVQVHESVGQLKKLVKLNLQECRRLENLPTLQTDKLEELILSGCSKLEKLPKFGRKMGNLYFLDVTCTDITEIPLSIIRLSNLKCLDLTYCRRLKSIPKLPPNVIISASNCRLLEPTSALPHLYASCAPKGPIHLFCDFQLWTRIPTWFEQWEYCWGKDTDGPTSREFVTITADIPSNVVADSNEERWGIAVCVVFQFLSKAWLGFSATWRRQAASFDTQFPATNIIQGLHDLEIMGCGWRLACKKDFDEWSENRAPSPLRLGFHNRDRGESSDNTIAAGKRKRKHPEILH
ncbi:hypothetical protein K1719_029995 [Acacia pycnantha]|nr:hypothetical protein K1719_029995 [Acacia pycnantha]